MSVFFWLLLLVAAYGAKINKEGCYSDYIGRDSIQPIKGIFILLVFISHFVQYVSLNGVWDAPYFEVRKFLAQMVVVPFLFYSGYGMAASIQAKGMGYIRRMPVHRIGKVLFQFALAVALFLILQFAKGARYKLSYVIPAFVGWFSVGNSNWYIFAIVCMYLITWISFALFRKGKLMPLLCASVLTAVYIVVMKLVKGQEVWCNTVGAYLAGMWFCAYKEGFDKAVLSKNRDYYIYLVLILSAFLFLKQYWNKLVVYEVVSVLFALLTVLVTAKVRITSKALTWCGEHLFSLFILQRIPMIALDNTAIEAYPGLFLVVCFLLTLPMCVVFDSLTPKAWNAMMSLAPKKKA